jgi:fucose permease
MQINAADLPQDAVLFLCVVGMVFCAFFFAIHDYGKVNVLLSFIVGFFTGAYFSRYERLR